jgi:hypothetical protein
MCALTTFVLPTQPSMVYHFRHQSATNNEEFCLSKKIWRLGFPIPVSFDTILWNEF